ncbi:MAG: hypothetical protein KC442_09760 [Thermomicrobiales bacterium]|nr:hypothetical protein [Thermomicrobiales bacterium]
MTNPPELRPLRPIRRFDVFAETKRIEALEHGEPEDVARGYGVRIAKVVAYKRFGVVAKSAGDTRATNQPAPQPTPEGNRFREVDGTRFRALDGVLQTDETFEREIVERMGPRFYTEVFQPAVAAALAQGETYQTFRDTIRAGWKPRRGGRSGARKPTAPSL